MNKVVVKRVFFQISKIYDFLINFVTLGQINNWQRELLEMLKKEGNRLDVGTGTGEILKKSQNEGFKVGIDLSKEMLKIAKTKCPDSYFILANAEELPFKDNFFHSITLLLTYRHLFNREVFLKEAFRVVGRDGELGIVLK